MLILLLIVSRAPGQDSPEIRDIRPFLRGDSLLCSFSAPDLFEGTIKQTLLSGLPVLLELQFRINGGRVLNASPPPLKYRVSYDIWEDRFLMESPGNQYLFPDIESLRRRWNPAEAGLAPLENPGIDEELIIECRLQIILLTRSQSQKMKDWVLNSAETEEDIPSMDRDTGFKLNLNQVVSLFLDKSDINESFEARGESEVFKIEDLPRKEKVGSKQ